MTKPYVTKKMLAELEVLLSMRERVLLQCLAAIRVATSVQLERLCFQDLTRRRAGQRLSRLVALRVLRRLPRVVGGERAGSAGYIYTLDVAGQRITQTDTKRRSMTVGAAFLKHSLLVTELFVRMKEARGTTPLRVVEFATEPACWRTFAGPGGGTATLKPDAYAVVQLGEFQDRWFIEVDRSTESTTTLARKAEIYRRYWQSGTEQTRWGIFPRVLWLVPDDKRHDEVVDVLGRMQAEAWPLFTVALFDQAVTRIIRGAHV